MLEKGVGVALDTDGGGRAVAGDDAGGVGEWQQVVVDGVEQLAGIAAGQVGAADRAGEEGVAGDEEALLGEVEADAALGVAGGMEDAAGEAGLAFLRARADGDDAAVGEVVVGRGDLGEGDAEPAGLDVHHLDEGKVVLVVEDGGAGELLEALGSGDVVDMGVGDEDLLDGEVVLREQGEDAGDVVAGIDDDGLAGGFITEDGAVAVEGANGEDLVDHGIILDRPQTQDAQALGPAHRENEETCRLLLGSRLRARGAGEDGVIAAAAREQDGQRDGEQHEEHGSPGGELGEQVGRTAGTEGGLRTLAAKGAGEVGGLALLQKNDSDEEEANYDMDEGEKVNHRELGDLFGTDATRRSRCRETGVSLSRWNQDQMCGLLRRRDLNLAPQSMDECITESPGTQIADSTGGLASASLVYRIGKRISPGGKQ